MPVYQSCNVQIHGFACLLVNSYNGTLEAAFNQLPTDHQVFPLALEGDIKSLLFSRPPPLCQLMSRFRLSVGANKGRLCVLNPHTNQPGGSEKKRQGA